MSKPRKDSLATSWKALGILWHAGVLTAAAVVALLATPAAAPAAITCELSGTLLTVTLGAGGDNAQLATASGSITVKNGFSPVTCTSASTGDPLTPTVASVGSMSVIGGGFNTVVIHGPHNFVPGANPQDGSDNAGGTPEIEIFVNLNNGTSSLFILDNGDQGGEIRIGTAGINATVSSEVTPDADIFPNNVGSVAVFGGAGGDTLGAQGGLGTGTARSGGISLNAEAASDSITGGSGADTLSGGMGDDALSGGLGDDSSDGGPGTDTATLLSAGPVALDLAITGPQDTGAGMDSFENMENAQAGPGNAVLHGDAGPNRLETLEGNDVLDGRGGKDTLEAGEGNDSLGIRDGGLDNADCGLGTDTVTADPPGIDMLVDCEDPIFPAGAAVGATQVVAVIDSVAPFFTGNAAATPKRFEVDRKGKREAGVNIAAKKGTTFNFSLSEAATVTFTIERRTAGRRVKGKCVKKTKPNRKNGRCDMFKRAGAFRALGIAGPNKKQFSGRIDRNVLKPGSYRAFITAVDTAGNRSKQAVAGFTVVRGHH